MISEPSTEWRDEPEVPGWRWAVVRVGLFESQVRWRLAGSGPDEVLDAADVATEENYGA